MREFSQIYPDKDKYWYETSNTVVILEGNLEKIQTFLKQNNQEWVEFKEPDLGNRLTGIGFLGNEITHKETRKLKLVK